MFGGFFKCCSSGAGANRGVGRFLPPPRHQISWRRSICCENFMSTLSEGKVLERFSTVVAVQGQIGEWWWEWWEWKVAVQVW